MYVVFDIGGSGIKIAIMSKDGEIKEKSNISVPATYEEMLNAFCTYIDDKKNSYELKGVAISAPGAVNHETGFIGGISAISYIHTPTNIPLDIYKRTGLFASIENDANCAGLGEVSFGKHQNPSMAFVVCGSGIGGAIVRDGKIFVGKNNLGGEFGYMLVAKVDDFYKPLSSLGAVGALVHSIKEKTGEKLNGKGIFERAEQGLEPYHTEVETMFEYLAIGLFNIQHICDPDIIVLGGAISVREDFIPRIQAKFEMMQQGNLMVGALPELKTCTFHNDTNLYGALANHLQGNIIKNL